jgi:hypothetical protein
LCASAVLDSVPVLTDALTGAGVGAFVGGMVAITVPTVLIGQALDFGGLAWLGALLVDLLLVSLVDRDYFYGSPPETHSH